MDTNGAIQSQVYSYFLKDHLGSINYLTASSGEVAQVLGFDPWGKRLASHQSEGTEPWATFQFDLLLTTRGFTGHEMVDKLNVIHMNGRIYDPTLARFLQADPFIQAASDGQMFNRYSYVRNNPLNATDPSGHFWQAVGAFLLKAAFFAGVSHMAFDMAQMSGASWLSTLVSIGACAFGDVAGCVGGAFGSSWAATGDLMSAVEAGGIAFASAFAFNYIGDYFAGVSGPPGEGFFAGTHGNAKLWLTGPQMLGKIASHAAVGGVMADLNGGKFAHGFISAGFVAAASPKMAGINGPQFNGIDVGQVAASAILGGTVSNITGGKFANGAITGAMQNLFNQQGAKNKPKRLPNEGDREWRRVVISVYETEKTGGTYGMLEKAFGLAGQLLGGNPPSLAGGVIGSLLDIDETTTYYIKYEAKQLFEYDLSPTYRKYTNEFGQINLEQTSRGRWVPIGDPVPLREIYREPSYVRRQSTIQN